MYKRYLKIKEKVDKESNFVGIFFLQTEKRTRGKYDTSEN